jgi:hypothetical protein
MREAIFKRRDWKRNNTEVSLYGDCVRVYLFGNLIAFEQDNHLHLNHRMLNKFPTVTTRSRLNALGFDVCQRDYQQIVSRDSVPLTVVL